MSQKDSGNRGSTRMRLYIAMGLLVLSAIYVTARLTMDPAPAIPPAGLDGLVTGGGAPNIGGPAPGLAPGLSGGAPGLGPAPGLGGGAPGLNGGNAGGAPGLAPGLNPNP
jgi:hypothetical protein